MSEKNRTETCIIVRDLEFILDSGYSSQMYSHTQSRRAWAHTNDITGHVHSAVRIASLKQERYLCLKKRQFFF